MFDSFFEAICRMGIFLICVRAILHFRPQEVYEKYLRLLAGIMILIQLFLPLGRFLLGKGGQEAVFGLQQFGQQMEQGMEEAVENARAADALLEQMALEEVRRRLEEQREAQEREALEEGASRGEEEMGQGSGYGSEEESGWKAGGEEAEETGDAGEGNAAAVNVKEIEPILIAPVKP